MTISLSKIPESQRKAVATKRVANGKSTLGLGYWGAMDYFRRMHMNAEAESKKKAEAEVAS